MIIMIMIIILLWLSLWLLIICNEHVRIFKSFSLICYNTSERPNIYDNIHCVSQKGSQHYHYNECISAHGTDTVIHWSFIILSSDILFCSVFQGSAEADVGWGGNLNGHLVASYVWIFYQKLLESDNLSLSYNQ